MVTVVMNLVVRVDVAQERSGDEGEFQIAAITAPSGRVEVELHRVDLARVPRPATDDLFGVTDRAELDLPVASISASDPYFAYAMRAIEFDESTEGMRQRDREVFVGSIRRAAQAVFDGGGRPTVDTIWLAANEPSLADRRNRGVLGLLAPWRWRDDDDLIGVSARTYPDLGTILDDLPRAPAPGAPVPGSRQWTELHFGREGASWSVLASVSGRRPR